MHFGFGEPIVCSLNSSAGVEPISAQIERLAEQIDQQVYQNFQLWPNNYIAEDILHNTSVNTGFYTSEQFDRFVAMLNEAVSIIPGDAEIIRSMFLQMYVNPIRNKRNSQLLK